MLWVKKMMTLQPPDAPMGKRYSIDTDELVKRIHASKPKSVFLDAKPKMTTQRATFGKKSKIDVTEQGLQSIKRAAFATETSDEVMDSNQFTQTRSLDEFFFF